MKNLWNQSLETFNKLACLKLYEGEGILKEWICVQVGNHRNISTTIESYQKRGWSLHTYQAQGSPTIVNHYLLFEKGNNE
jgi:hypothetical protein